MLMKLLRHTDTESVLVFTRTKHRAKRLGDKLGKAGYRSASLQGNLSQNRRKAAAARRYPQSSWGCACWTVRPADSC